MKAPWKDPKFTPLCKTTLECGENRKKRCGKVLMDDRSNFFTFPKSQDNHFFLKFISKYNPDSACVTDFQNCFSSSGIILHPAKWDTCKETASI